MRVLRYQHEFVEFIPDVLLSEVLYVSMEYTTAVHRCFCGCGEKVVTPIAPTDWRLTFDGVDVSLDPSIGNWSLPCRSHYWLTDGKVHWAETWTQRKIERKREKDHQEKADYYTAVEERTHNKPSSAE
jgi:hypothetical protein